MYQIPIPPWYTQISIHEVSKSIFKILEKNILSDIYMILHKRNVSNTPSNTHV